MLALLVALGCGHTRVAQPPRPHGAPAVSNVEALPLARGALVIWSASRPGATYELERQPGCAGSFAPLVANVAALAYVDEGIGRMEACYRVRENGAAATAGEVVARASRAQGDPLAAFARLVRQPNAFRSLAQDAEPVDALPDDVLPAPIVDDHPAWVRLYWRAWELARRHRRSPQPGSGLPARFVDAAFNGNLFQWDTIFMLAYWRYAPTFPAIRSLDNFYTKQHDDGYICREIHGDGREFHYEGVENTVNPPLFSWAEWRHFRATGDRSRLEPALVALAKHFRWIEANRTRGNGLYWNTGFGAGEDDLVRNTSADAWVDMTAQQAQNALFLARIAHEVAHDDVAAYFAERYLSIRDALVRAMWSPKARFFFDLRSDGNPVGIKTILGFWPMLARVPDVAQAEALVTHLRDEREFWRPSLVPVLARDEAGYSAEGQYWNGAVWAPTNYMLVEGLEEYGHGDVAHLIGQRYLDVMATVAEQTGTIWENYAPETATGKGNRDFVGWSGVGPIAILIESVLGIRADSAERTVHWSPRLRGRHGIERLAVGHGHVNLLASAIEQEGRTLTMSSDVALDVIITSEGRELRQHLQPRRTSTVVLR